MQKKDIDKELAFLDNYFKNIINTQVTSITFSNSINSQQFYKIDNGDWSSLKTALLSTKYDGIAFYDTLLFTQESDIILLFTDGVEIIDKLKIDNSIPTFAISSTKDVNTSKLLEQTLPTGGNYINLNNLSVKEALATVLGINSKAIVAKKQIISKTTNTTINEEIIGRVYGAEGVLTGATVRIKNKKTGTITNSKGEFSIKANKGEILVINYLGKKTKTITIDNLEEAQEILLIGSENVLDEVVVTGQGNQEPELVETGFGKVNKDKLGYAVRTIDSKELMSGNATNISDAVRSKMGAVHYTTKSADISKTIFRNGEAGLLGGDTSNKYALIVIDGVPFQRPPPPPPGITPINDSFDIIDPENVASVTVLKGLAATNRYGTQGAGGVILITTKMSLAGKKKKTPYNSALVRGNDFTESLTEVNNSIAHLPYIKALNKHQTLSAVYDAYLVQRVNHLQDPLYFVNVSDFVSQWGNKQLATKILSNVLELHPKDVRLLRLVAFKIEQHDKFLAKRIYEKIALLKPKEAQSYRDLALIYQETGYYQEALDIYKKILNNNYPQVNFSGSKKHIDNELKRLILLHKNKLNVTGIPTKYLNIKKIACDARIVFDWNDRMADFELQFVNPQKKFFIWSHNKFENEMRIEKEQLQGFNSEEFLLTGSMKGEWLINIESNSENKNNPVVIKYTVYKNYGTPKETKTTKLLILDNINNKQMVGKIKI
ncbi:carboxypeptidase-like regulatory domain-containing protein [Olleya sp. AH-315-F22]|nr:carboxypeptidase-like regulatory domain-containing protein [Olleya sp. AH-315-F22]